MAYEGEPGVSPKGHKVREASAGRLFVEGLIIVLSILLAFAIDAGWEYRGDRAREAELLGALTQEYRANRATLQTTVGLVRADIGLAEAFFSTDSAGISSAGPTWGALYRPWTIELASGATTAALSAGNLELIRDPVLLELVAGWPARTRDLQERGRVMVGFEQAWYEFLAQQPDAQQATTRIGERFQDLPGLLRAVRYDDEARARVAIRSATAGIYIRQMEELLTLIDTTLVMLEKN